MLAEGATSLLPLSIYSTLPLWPLLGAILVGLLIAARARAEAAHWPVVLGVGLSAVLGIMLFFDLPNALHSDTPAPAGEAAAAMQQHEDVHDAHGDHALAAPPQVEHDPVGPGITYTIYNWLSLGQDESLNPESDKWISVNFFFDGLTGIMLLFVTVVSTLIVIYAIGYMRDHHGHPERGYARFFAFLGLFVFSMSMLVLAGNFALLYLGWELVGLCSYLLIGFYYSKPSAAAAAKKAFIVNRIGDFGFALGIFTIYWFISPLTHAGENPLDYAVVFKYAGDLSQYQVTLIALLLLCGALGKSAQFPLYVWLPDAMEGPTPVSALIHAATMVTAGVYMVARCGPIFSQSEVALWQTIVVLGTIGAVLTATMAMAQYDMKRILAYSTISQLAYMFVALGVSAPASGVFHVFTHAFFKALLFLGAGSVMLQMGHVIDLRRFSGLRTVLPETRRVMLIGCLALSGFPLLAGFWSKDEIVHAAFEYHWIVGVLLLITAFMTAYYTFRMYFLCFHGPKRIPAEAGDHPHESPPVMIRPLYVLALGAIGAGFLGVWPEFAPTQAFLGFLKPHGYFHEYLHASTVVSGEGHSGGIWLMYLSAVIALAGIGLAWLRYGNAPQEDPDKRLFGPLFTLWHNKYWIDELYDRVFVRPLHSLGEFFFATDRYGVDGLIWFVTAVPRGLGAGLRVLQSGAIQAYALSMAVGLAALLLLWRWLESGAAS